MRLSREEHRRHGFEIDKIAADFELLDVWGLPARGHAAQFAEFCDAMKTLDPPGDSAAVRALFRLRAAIGHRFGWDTGDPRPIPGCTEVSLRERMSVGVVEPPDAMGFSTFLRTDREQAREISNSTVHAIMHTAWVPRGDEYGAQMAVFVKCRGRVGRVYMSVISPFRHWIVYPSMVKEVGRAWRARQASPPAARNLSAQERM